ncbi:taste receptor type 2 member 1-like [Latimeria chalumnae]|uniref:taste receptor type 2 member 1-like n=1 Tax=Latimeria chalumnae TaxID=7897 RepID=UPI0003C135AE|nr:PREDICTED: taste receptor type 2 member 1-like [Latimeria chalumnae]|eukprot:XP_006013508.1 PREDICTED: taste receptor type 2 member 1-like [Latimeria chalumnae]
MVTVDIILQLAAILFVIVFGIIGNLFIVIINFQELRRTGTLQPSERIVSCIAVSNILAVIVLAIWFIIFLLDLCTYLGPYIYKVTDFLIVFITKVGYWFTAWLCFFYCVKIVKINWRIFIKLKQGTSLLVSFLLFATVVCSFGVAYPAIYIIRTLNTTSIVGQCKGYYILGHEFMMGYIVFVSFIASLLPLALMLLSSLGIVFFLLKHSKNMTKTSNVSSSPQNEGPTTVVKMVISLIVLYIVSVISILVTNHVATIIESDMVVIIASSSCVFSAGSSVILIVGTVKLRQAFLKIFCSAGQCYNKCRTK